MIANCPETDRYAVKPSAVGCPAARTPRPRPVTLKDRLRALPGLLGETASNGAFRRAHDEKLVYLPPRDLLAGLAAPPGDECAPATTRALGPVDVLAPAQAGVRALREKGRERQPKRSAPSLLHQVLSPLWLLRAAGTRAPEAGSLPCGAKERCQGTERPLRSSLSCDSQVPPPVEVGEVVEPPQAQSPAPSKTVCEPRCGLRGPGLRQVSPRVVRAGQDSGCAGEHKFEDVYTPFPPPQQQQMRGKPSSSPCPCECKCTWHFPSSSAFVPFLEWLGRLWSMEPIDPLGAALGSAAGAAPTLHFPDHTVGIGPAPRVRDGAAVNGRGYSPALDFLASGQSAGLGLNSGLDLDLGLMQPPRSASEPATGGIPGPVVLAAPSHPDARLNVLLRSQALDEGGPF
jgi:hypothetical protein